MSLNWLDFGIIAVILFSVIVSFFRGFFRETISLATWITGFILAVRFAPRLSNALAGFITTEMLRYIISFVLLFVGVFIIGLLLTMIVKKGIDASGFTFIDRLLGIGFGAVRGILLTAIVLMFMTMTAFKNMNLMVGSRLSPSFMPMVTWLDGFLPQQLDYFSRWMKVDDMPFHHPSTGTNSNSETRLRDAENSTSIRE